MLSIDCMEEKMIIESTLVPSTAYLVYYRNEGKANVVTELQAHGVKMSMRNNTCMCIECTVYFALYRNEGKANVVSECQFQTRGGKNVHAQQHVHVN